MNKVLITGITGFVGSAIAEYLVNKGVQVIGLKRDKSDIWRCATFADKVNWVTIDQEEVWQSIIITENPKVIIHCAWIGVLAHERDDWYLQEKNLAFLKQLFCLCTSLQISKFIFIGSQAEYGRINGKIGEDAGTLPEDAYAKVKLQCLKEFQIFCEVRKISWNWLRLFSVFGEKEGDNWLIPSVIKKMMTEAEMNFTLGEQKYAYLYIKDFANLIFKLLNISVPSGVYNVSAEEARSLSSIIEEIKLMVNPEFTINLGVLPYRPFQSMHLQGDSSKLKKYIGNIELTDFHEALQQTINYYRSKYTNHESI